MEVLRFTPTGYWLQRDKVVIITNRVLKRGQILECDTRVSVNLSSTGCDNEDFALANIAHQHNITLENLKDQLSEKGEVILAPSLKDQE